MNFLAHLDLLPQQLYIHPFAGGTRLKGVHAQAVAIKRVLLLTLLLAREGA